MVLIAPLFIVAAGLLALTILPADAPIAGMSHAGLASATAACALMASLIFGGGVLPLVRALATATTWALFVLALWFGYENRDALADLADQALEALSGPEASVGSGGEVTIRRGFGGSFLVSARVNDRPVRFVFDTGASVVVLTAEDALRVGLDPSRLVFSAEVITANGPALAAPARLARVAVGPIAVRNVRALVTRPGAMSECLLGMSFLEELDSYKVEKGRLTLTARKG